MPGPPAPMWSRPWHLRGALNGAGERTCLGSRVYSLNPGRDTNATPDEKCGRGQGHRRLHRRRIPIEASRDQVGWGTRWFGLKRSRRAADKKRDGALDEVDDEAPARIGEE